MSRARLIKSFASEKKMAMKLYVGNLSYSTTKESLAEACARYGTVADAVVITDKMSGRSKGFGFVTMGSDEEAQAVLNGLNGTELDGRELRISEARPMEDRPKRSFNRDDRGPRRW